MSLDGLFLGDGALDDGPSRRPPLFFLNRPAIREPPRDRRRLLVRLRRVAHAVARRRAVCMTHRWSIGRRVAPSQFLGRRRRRRPAPPQREGPHVDGPARRPPVGRVRVEGVVRLRALAVVGRARLLRRRVRRGVVDIDGDRGLDPLRRRLRCAEERELRRPPHGRGQAVDPRGDGPHAQRATQRIAKVAAVALQQGVGVARPRRHEPREPSLNNARVGRRAAHGDGLPKLRAARVPRLAGEDARALLAVAITVLYTCYFDARVE
mmetsp:Transcript_19954/g.61576  ORF Transcript_19954/g.61576 Transcript_19954/m.61576 type:complete len:265 (+) Transcript_19954:29-823(+)